MLKRNGRIAASASEDIERLIASGNIRIILDSIFIQKMRSYYSTEGNVNLMNYLQIIAQFYPNIDTAIDFGILTKLVAKGLGVNEEAIIEDKKTQELLQQKAQMAQQQMEAQQMQMLNQGGVR